MRTSSTTPTRRSWSSTPRRRRSSRRSATSCRSCAPSWCSAARCRPGAASCAWDDVLRGPVRRPSPTSSRDQRGRRGDDLHVGHDRESRRARCARAPTARSCSRCSTSCDLLHENSVHLTTGPLYHSGPLAFASLSHTLGAPIVVLRKFDPVALDRAGEGAPRHQHVLRAHAAEAHRLAPRRRARAGRHVVDDLPDRERGAGAVRVEAGDHRQARRRLPLRGVRIDRARRRHRAAARGPAAQARLVREAVRRHRDTHREGRRRRSRAPARRASCSCAPASRWTATTTPTSSSPSCADERVEVGRRRRLRRRRGLRLHLRPQEGHDHLGRRQHLSGRDRGGALRAPASCSTPPCSASPTTSGASACTRSCRPSRARRSTSTSCAPSPSRGSRATSGRATTRSATELPRTDSGKLLKRVLRDEYWQRPRAPSGRGRLGIGVGPGATSLARRAHPLRSCVEAAARALRRAGARRAHRGRRAGARSPPPTRSATRSC